MFSETADTDVLRSVFLSQMLVYGQEKDAGEDEPGCEAHDAVYEKTFSGIDDDGKQRSNSVQTTDDVHDVDIDCALQENEHSSVLRIEEGVQVVLSSGQEAEGIAQ
jgi:hypothetical protein